MEKKYIVLAVVVTALVILGISEGVKAQTRTAALAELNAVYPSLKTADEIVAAYVKANTIIAQNRSFFDFNFSSADEGNLDWRPLGSSEDEPALLEGGEVNWTMKSIEATVDTYEGYDISVYWDEATQSWGLPDSGK